MGASLLYNYVPCDGGKCAEAGASAGSDPEVPCDNNQVCVATLSGGKINFETVQDSAYDGSIGQQEMKDDISGVTLHVRLVERLKWPIMLQDLIPRYANR